MPNRRKRIIRKLQLREISGVDFPAQQGARALIIKRYDDRSDDKGDKGNQPVGKGGLSQVLTSVTNGHQHGIQLRIYSDGDLDIWVDYAQATDSVDNHSHSLVRDAEGNYTVSENAGHTHTVDTAAINAAIAGMVQKGDDTMDPKEVEKLRKHNDRLAKIVALSAIVKAHFDELPDTAAEDAFLELSKEDQTKAVEKAAAEKKADDPIVYTTKAGVELRKSDGASAVALAKSFDAQQEQMAELVESNKALAKRNEDAEYRSRVSSEIPNLPGTVDSRIALLKSIDGIENDEERKKAQEDLKAQNTSFGDVFKFQGITGNMNGSDPEQDNADPQAKLDKMAEELQKADPKLSLTDAMTKALDTDEGSALYEQIVARDRQVAAAA